MPIVTVFVVANILIGCYVAIRLGYGPPHWVTALNLVVPALELQNRLNAGRDWLEEKIPWTIKLFKRFDLPNPIIFIDISAVEDTESEEETPETTESEETVESEDHSTDEPMSSDEPAGNGIQPSAETQTQA